ncbi:cilia- and flagella-associated protein HOATZ [Hippoglossus stenolepis]|uniref:cilia- and flagella-associated protein HOATZ n=1 Tax=Hippoglossus stenolepis TaxID=195615 RepID=UPI00159C0310|nr:cilia- and flagella-associated protein HOATZ [Hippoglossus stenolepis]
MSVHPEDLDQFFTVFDGSAPEDVSHARQLWSSMSMLPPLESRLLLSADIRQRLPVSRPQRGSTAAAGPRTSSASETPSAPALRQRREERQRYEAMADQRREILALLRRRREQRIQKELLSEPFKPKVKLGGGNALKVHQSSDCEMDAELVKQLQ